MVLLQMIAVTMIIMLFIAMIIMHPLLMICA
jgi:hypothetical protein